jgi:hypothetical protein
VAAQREEILVDPYRIEAEDVSPDLDQRLFGGSSGSCRLPP